MTVPEQKIPQPIPTFEQAEQSGRILSDKFILGAVTHALEVAPGHSAVFVKNYLDLLPADKTDREFASDPDELINFRNETTDFVATHLTIFTNGLSPREVGRLRTLKRNFTERLEEEKDEVNDFIRQFVSGRRPRPRYPEQAAEYYGLNVKTNDGIKDLLTTSIGQQARANLEMQRQITALFVQWDSSGYVKSRLHQEPLDPLTKRIYLNPKMSRTVDIFTQIVDKVDAAGLNVKGKMLDRSLEALERNKVAYRGDGIVLYASDKEADRLLSLANEVYNDNYGAFSGRRVSRIVKPVGAGMGVGDQPLGGETLTSHRSVWIDEAAYQTRQLLGKNSLDQAIEPHEYVAAIATFRRIWRDIANEAGINADNVAFNKRQ